jgi:hypothetical protein
MGKIDMSKDMKLKRQKGVGGIGNQAAPFGGPFKGPSSDSQHSKYSLPLPPRQTDSGTESPLLSRINHQYQPTLSHHHSNPNPTSPSSGLQHQQSDTSGTRSDKKEILKWSGVKISFDADSVKIENEVNGGPPGIKKLGKEVLTFSPYH